MKKILLFLAVWLIYSFGMSSAGFSQNATTIYKDGFVKVEQLAQSWQVVCGNKVVAHGNGILDINNLPPAFQDLLDYYARLDEATVNRSMLRGQGVSDQYGPLISSHWRQHEPYNNLCPISEGERVVTGCSTISTGQLLYYFRYCNPIDVSGTNKSTKTNNLSAPYISNTVSTSTEVTYDYEYSYTPNFNKIDKDNEELAQFIVAIALAQKANFGVKATSTVTTNQYNALTSTFGYQGEFIHINSLTEGDYISSQIKKGFPVLISGSDNDGAHSFLIDGYNGSEFHVNYGWGGTDDAWVSTTLYPKSQRIQTVYPNSPNATGMQTSPTYLHITGGDGFSKKIAMRQAGDNALEYKQEDEVTLSAGIYQFWFEYENSSTIAPYSDTVIVMDKNYNKKGHFSTIGANFILNEAHSLNFWHLQNKGEIKIEVVDRRIDVVAHVTDETNNPIQGAYVTTSSTYPLPTTTYKNENFTKNGYRLSRPFIWTTTQFTATKPCLNKIDIHMFKKGENRPNLNVGILDKNQNVIWSKTLTDNQVIGSKWTSIKIDGTIKEGSETIQLDGNLMLNEGEEYYMGLMVEEYDSTNYYCYYIDDDTKEMNYRVTLSDYFVNTDASGTCTLKMEKDVAQNLYAHYTNYTFLPEKIDQPETIPHHIYFKGVKTSTLNTAGLTLESISIITLPDKTEYIKGESLNLEGLTVAAVYDNGTKVQITDYSVSETEAEENSEFIRSTITVSYEGKTAEFPVYWHRHNIHYVVDGKPYQTVKNNIVGNPISLIEKPQKAGYVLNWDCAYTTMPDKDIVITGTYIISSHKVTYLIDGEIFATLDKVEYGTEISSLKVKSPSNKEGYTFSGWTCDYTTMPDTDIEITGSYIPNKHTITYTVDGEIYSTIENVSYNSPIVLIDNPEEKEGHTFSGWTCEYTTMPDMDITITGSFTLNTHTITYLIDGEIHKTVSDVAFGSEITFIKKPTKTGYTFKGWNCDYTTMPDMDIEVTGSYTVRKYNIAYTIDGDTIKTVKVAYGSTITLIDEPEAKEGYTFSGWTCDHTTMPAKNITITGTYSLNHHKITYIVDGETTDVITDVPYGSEIILKADSSKIGYTFSGWTCEYTIMPDMDIEVTGSFTINLHTITYLVDGKKYEVISDVPYGNDITLIDDPEKRTGYTFSGWVSEYTKMPDQDIQIQGSFTVNKYTISYLIDGEAYETVPDVPFNSEIAFIPEPTKEGYTFSGWVSEYTIMPDQDIQIQGSFTVNKHSITYLIDGEVYKTIPDVAYSLEIAFIAEPSKEGYTFSGWVSEYTEMPDQDIQIQGSFTANKHSITYLIDGEVYRTVPDVPFDSEIALLSIPEKEGYEFKGWETEYTTMPDMDIKITGTFVPLTYNITYMVDGKSYKTVENVAYGSTLVLIDAPEKEGHTFSGWVCDYTTMPNQDLTITGSFSANLHNIQYLIDGENYELVKEVPFGSEIKLLDPAEKEGYTFTGWICKYTTMPDMDIVVEGGFEVNKHTITYLINGETHKTIEGVAFGSEIKLLENPSKEGYTFSGWTCDYEIMPDLDITINGSFKVNLHTISYLLDGEPYQAIEDVAFGSEIKLLEAPSKEGYTFSGWTCDYETMPDLDITITGSFKMNLHTITYTLDGQPYQVIADVPFGSKIDMLEEPTKKGYTFNGWICQYETMPDKNITIAGSFTIKSCTIIANAENGTVTGGSTYEFGTIATLTAIADSGYHFVRWSDDNKENPRTIAITANMVDNNPTLSLTAIFEEDEKTWIIPAETEAIPVKVYAYDNTIIIENAEAEIYVFNTAGSLIAHVNQPFVYTEIPVANAGVYIVKVGSMQQKVVIGNK